VEIPSKVKNLLWRICRNCLPTRYRLHNRGVDCVNNCDDDDDDDDDGGGGGGGVEDSLSFFQCPKALIASK
jgi:hypothetical protein